MVLAPSTLTTPATGQPTAGRLPMEGRLRTAVQPGLQDPRRLLPTATAWAPEHPPFLVDMVPAAATPGAAAARRLLPTVHQLPRQEPAVPTDGAATTRAQTVPPQMPTVLPRQGPVSALLLLLPSTRPHPEATRRRPHQPQSVLPRLLPPGLVVGERTRRPLPLPVRLPPVLTTVPRHPRRTVRPRRRLLGRDMTTRIRNRAELFLVVSLLSYPGTQIIYLVENRRSMCKTD